MAITVFKAHIIMSALIVLTICAKPYSPKDLPLITCPAKTASLASVSISELREEISRISVRRVQIQAI